MKTVFVMKINDIIQVFETQNLAIEYINKNWEGAVECTKECKPQWLDFYSTIHYQHTKEQFNSDGSWDWPIVTNFEIDEYNIIDEV